MLLAGGRAGGGGAGGLVVARAKVPGGWASALRACCGNGQSSWASGRRGCAPLCGWQSPCRRMAGSGTGCASPSFSCARWKAAVPRTSCCGSNRHTGRRSEVAPEWNLRKMWLKKSIRASLSDLVLHGRSALCLPYICTHQSKSKSFRKESTAYWRLL